MNNKALIEAMRAILPYAVERADELRARAGDAAQRWPAGAGAEYAAQLATRAEAATHAITAARIALQDADAAALDVREEYRYAVTFPDLWAPGDRLYGRAHVVHVMADCEAQAEDRALAALAAAGFEPTTAGVLHVRRVVA